MNSASRVITAALLASAGANVLFNLDVADDFQPETFLLDALCTEFDAEAACVESLAADHVSLLNDNGVAERQAQVDEQNASIEALEKNAASGLKAALDALEAKPTSRVLITWCENETRRVGARAGLSHAEVKECTDICLQVKKGVDSNEVFTCLDGKVGVKIEVAENAGNSVAFDEALDARIEQFAFFNTTLDDADRAAFSTAAFDSASTLDNGLNNVLEATDEAFLAFEAGGSLDGVPEVAAAELQSKADRLAFATGFVSLVGADAALQGELAEVREIDAQFGADTLDGLFEAQNALLLETEPLPQLSIFEINEDVEADAALAAELNAAFGDEFVAFAVLEQKKRAGVSRVAVASGGAKEQFVNDLTLLRVCVERQLECKLVAVLQPSALAVARADFGVVEPTTAAVVADTTAYKPTKAPAGYDDEDDDESNESESSSDEEESASTVALSFVAAAASLMAFF